MFKKAISVILILMMVLTLSACKDKDGNVEDEVQAEQTENISGDIDSMDSIGDEDLDDDEEGSIPIVSENPSKVENPVSTGVPVDEYYLDNGDPTIGDDTSITGMPRVIDSISVDDGNLLVLVNKFHIVSKDYKPTDMVYMDNDMTTYTNLELKSEAYEAYKKLYQDACDLGFDLKVCSAYRTYNTQTTLFVNSLKNRGRETTNIRSAYPGRSEHHTGLSVDITSNSMGMTLSQDFADYEDGKWLNDHCQDYGFILRYPNGKTDITGYAYEPWHFRYVGVDVAKDIMSQGITLEEYLGKVDQ